MRRKSLLILTIPAVIAVPILATAAFGAPANGEALPTKITVNATEFKFALVPRTGKKGTIVFTVINKGKIAHDFKIKGKKTANIPAGKRATLRVTFTTKGRYPYLCTLPSHAPAGMKGVLVVS